MYSKGSPKKKKKKLLFEGDSIYIDFVNDWIDKHF